LAPAGALAQERLGDAALGAASGAIVLGPVGAAAGALIGYTAGPAIARSWGIGGRKRYHARRAKAAANRTAATEGNAPRKVGRKSGWYNTMRH
jgi:hypothetical protein